MVIFKVGDKVGKRTIIELPEERDKGHNKLALCKCDCGFESLVRLTRLKNNEATSCRCARRLNTLEVGTKISNWTVIKNIEERDKYGNIQVQCKCICENEKILRVSRLIGGSIKSCGCIPVLHPQRRYIPRKKELVQFDLVPVKGYEEFLFINKKGALYSTGTGKLKRVNTNIDFYGYETWNLGIDGRNGYNKTLKIHRLMAETFIPNLDNKLCVNHIDCNRSNNQIENLEWCTHKENMVHACINNRFPDRRGTKSPRALLTSEQVQYIRDNYKAFDKENSGRKLAAKFNVTPTTISYVVTNKGYLE